MSSPQSHLPNTFRNLKIYSSKVAQFVLQWHDLDDYLHSINSQLQHLEAIHKANSPPQNESLNRPNSPKPSIQPQGGNPESSSSNNPLVAILRERRLPNYTVFDALRSTPNPAKLGLEALRLFYPSNSGKDSGNLSVVRRNCVVLLDDLKRVMCSVEPEVRKEAIEMALDWQSKMTKTALEFLGFLMLVDTFGLADEFDKDEIFQHFDSIVCYEQAPQLLRDLGFSDKATDFVQKLIESNKRFEAIPFIHAYKLADKFPLVPLLKAHAAFAEANYERISTKGTNSDNGTSTMIGTLRGILKVIKKYKLEYPAGDIRKQIKQLRKQLDDLKAAETSEVQKQVQIENKREAPSKPQLDRQTTDKRLKMAEPANYSPSPNAATRTWVKPNPSLFSRSGEERADVSQRTEATRTWVQPKQPSLSHVGEERANFSGKTDPASTGACVSSTSANLTHRPLNFPHLQQFSIPVFGHGVQMLENFAGSAQVTAPFNFRGTGSGASAPFNGHFFSTAGQYGSSRGPDASSLVLQYRPDGSEARPLGSTGFFYANRYRY